MIFEKILKRAEIIEEARTSKFETLFQTGYLKKAIEDKKLGVARPIVFKFIIDFLKEKGLVPEGTSFAGARYAAEAGEFIKNLVDSGMVKDEIADEFRTYTQANLGQFLMRLQQVRNRGKGEMVNKTFKSKEDFQEFGKVKTAEELAASKAAAKSAEVKPDPTDISPTSPIDAKSSIVEIVADENVVLDVAKIQKFFTSANKSPDFDIDQGSLSAVDIEFPEESPITKVVVKLGADKVEASLKASLTKVLGLDPDEFGVVVHAPGMFDFEPMTKTKRSDRVSKAQRTGIDDLGYGTGTIAQDDSERRLANPFEDEEVPVKEHVVKYITTRELFKPKTYWQQIQQIEEANRRA